MPFLDRASPVQLKMNFSNFERSLNIALTEVKYYQFKEISYDSIIPLSYANQDTRVFNTAMLYIKK